MPPRITVVTTGGTIASTSGDGGATPTETGRSLIDAVPALSDHADVTVEEVARTPSFDLDVGTMTTVTERVRTAASDADGIVVTQGTDTMEESAYYLDLVLDLDVPVVFTGAQRRPDETSNDGPANLRTAVRATAHTRIEGGVYVAFDEELHTARDVRKIDTSKLGAFASPGSGPVAAFDRTAVRFHREPVGRSETIPVPEPDGTVDTVPTGIGVDGRRCRRAVDAGVDGLVVEATGVGNTTAALGDAIRDAIDASVPVVIASRCPRGAVAPVYGTGGGGRTLREHGAIFGGDLPASKARIKLLLATAATDDLEEIRELFADREAGHRNR